MIPASEAALSPGAAHWRDFGPRLSGLRPPLSPAPSAVAALARHIAGSDAHVLLLGATAPLFGLGRRLTMVDKCGETIARLWPGDAAERGAVIADWRDLAAPAAPFTAIVGDGSFNALASLDEVAAVHRRLAAVAPGAQAALRSFVRPDRHPDPAALAREALAGGAAGFHGFKLRLLMAVAADHGRSQVPLRAVHAAFEALFPDRVALGAATGWPADTIAEIDAYRSSPASLLFPTAAQLRAVLGVPDDLRFARSGDYEGAALCPILAWRIAE